MTHCIFESGATPRNLPTAHAHALASTSPHCIIATEKPESGSNRFRRERLDRSSASKLSDTSPKFCCASTRGLPLYDPPRVTSLKYDKCPHLPLNARGQLLCRFGTHQSLKRIQPKFRYFARTQRFSLSPTYAYRIDHSQKQFLYWASLGAGALRVLPRLVAPLLFPAFRKSIVVTVLSPRQLPSINCQFHHINQSTKYDLSR